MQSSRTAAISAADLCCSLLDGAPWWAWLLTSVIADGAGARRGGGLWAEAVLASSRAQARSAALTVVMACTIGYDDDAGMGVAC
jgi:hypothetical protein